MQSEDDQYAVLLLCYDEMSGRPPAAFYTM